MLIRNIRRLSTVSKLQRYALCCFVLSAAFAAQAQNISGHYVSKAEADGMIYHTFPETLFANRAHGDLTFDITYKESKEGIATINFTYTMDEMTPADSIHFSSAGRIAMAGKVEKLFVEPTKKRWTHRYSFKCKVMPLYSFFDREASPEITIFSGGEKYTYPAKRAAWNSYAPIGYKIFKMIRLNDQK